MGVYKRKGNKHDFWYIRYQLNGRDKWESVGQVGVVTKTVAQNVLRERKRQISLGQYDIIGVEIPTIAEFEKEYITYIRDIKNNRSWKLAEYYLSTLKQFFSDKKLSQITVNDIDEYKIKRLKEVKPASVNRELACLSHLFNYAKRQKRYFGENPVSLSRLIPENNQKERILTSHEEESLLNASPGPLRSIIITALCTGMRKNEILTLRWNNVDLNNNLITIDHTNTKSKKTRRIPINTKLKQLFRELRLKSAGNEYVFLSTNGNRYKRHDSLKKIYNRTCKLANISGLRFHDLRHTAATRMIENGVNIVAVSKILGHADLKTTMRYAHPDASLKEAVEILGNTLSI